VRKAREDSPVAPRPSNRPSSSLLGFVARACREAGGGAVGDAAALDRVLGLAVAATRTERAFVVRSELAGAPTIEAYHGPPDRCSSPSRTAVRLVAGRDRALIRPALEAGDRLLDGESVRALALRSVLAASVPHVVPARILLLDGRAPAGVQLPTALAEALDAFAAVVGMTLALSPCATPSPSSTEAAADPTVRAETMRDALAWADRAARTELPVLVRGETGAGKERFAQRIHARSRRHAGPLLAINCAAVPESLLEAELFGSVRGAYTGADRDRVGLFRQAHGGTLFLDEIGEMPPAMQAKLLRALEDRRVRPIGGAAEVDVDARLVAATHRDLSRLVERGGFRSDLFHRLAVLEVLVPPLRDRIEDLRALVAELAPQLSRETGCVVPQIDEDAWHALETHAWPGNVRELRAVLARAMLRAGPEPLSARHLGPLGGRGGERTVGPSSDSLERRMIVDALDRADGVVAHAARRIGWTRQKLARRMRAIGIAR
jgi:DNA-binding NtrC family response regulator